MIITCRDSHFTETGTISDTLKKHELIIMSLLARDAVYTLPNTFIRMVLFKKEGLSKSKIVISEIYLHVYAIYLKITKHKTLPLALDLFTYLIRTIAMLDYVM